MINQWLERCFGSTPSRSRDQVKQRLQVILAHDRIALSPQILEQMRQEIMAVVAKYVEIDQEAMEINLEADQRITMMVANLPITRIKSTESDLENTSSEEQMKAQENDLEIPELIKHLENEIADQAASESAN